MDEARRFLRYVTPGVAFAVELIIILLVVLPDWTVDRLVSLKDDQGVGLAIALLLASGGFGFVASTLHHEWHWRSSKFLDHRAWLGRLSQAGILELRETPNGSAMPADDIAKMTSPRAWAVLTAVWHERAKGDLEAPTKRATELTDLAHALGTMRVISMLAPLLALWVLAEVGSVSLAAIPVLRFVGAALIVLVLGFCHWRGYARASLLARNFIEQSITDCLTKESPRPIVVNVPPVQPSDPAA